MVKIRILCLLGVFLSFPICPARKVMVGMLARGGSDWGFGGRWVFSERKMKGRGRGGCALA